MSRYAHGQLRRKQRLVNAVTDLVITVRRDRCDQRTFLDMRQKQLYDLDDWQRATDVMRAYCQGRLDGMIDEMERTQIVHAYIIGREVVLGQHGFWDSLSEPEKERFRRSTFHRHGFCWKGELRPDNRRVPVSELQPWSGFERPGLRSIHDLVQTRR